VSLTVCCCEVWLRNHHTNPDAASRIFSRVYSSR
jgi:hypothetical protein